MLKIPLLHRSAILALPLVSVLLLSGCITTYEDAQGNVIDKPSKPRRPAAQRPPAPEPRKPQAAAVAVVDEPEFKAFIKDLRAAVHARNTTALTFMMTADFGYSLTPLPQGDGPQQAFDYWNRNKLWSEIDSVLASEFAPNGAFVIAPAQVTIPGVGYQGYVAGIARYGQEWKFAYFVNGQ